MPKTESQHDAVAVVDFGGQYAHLIATKVRRQQVRADILQPEAPLSAFAGYKGVILSGSPALTSEGDEGGHSAELFGLQIPILGLCFGHQQIAHHYGGTVVNGGREWGHAALHLKREHPLFSGLAPVQRVWMSHFDSVASLGADFEELGHSIAEGTTTAHRYAAIGSDRLQRYGFQFHPEVDDTEMGEQMLANFVRLICGCEPSWTMESYAELQVEAIRREVGPRSVFLLASGGVDSTVAALLFQRALGNERLSLLHIDNGLMRQDESRKVLELLREQGFVDNLHFVDASEDFLQALGETVEPEQKRAIIGKAFVEVFDREARRLGFEDHLLGQGTIYPDTIESGGTKRAQTIKTHHNRVPLIEELIAKGAVIEPLAELYKTEVRELGEQLGLPRRALWRHPFPGPGLGVRLLCADGQQRDPLSELDTAAAVVAKRFGLAARVLPVRSVGVKADVRSYEHPVLLAGAVPWASLKAAANALLKEVDGVNRCIWSLASTLPQTCGARAAHMRKERLDLLRTADALVMDGLRRHGLYDSIWQCPTVFVPLDCGEAGDELCVIRAIHSARAMTATAAELPLALLEELRGELLALSGVGAVAIDLTSKPPGTIEWE